MLPRLAQRWRYKPEIPVEIDWGHPLARGLAFCMPFTEGAGQPTDLVSGNLLGKSGTWLVGPSGRSFNNSPAFAGNRFASLEWRSGDFSVGCLIRAKSVSSLFAKPVMYAGGGNGWWFQEEAGVGQLSFDTSNGQNVLSASGVLNIGDNHLVFTADNALSLSTLYVNGVAVATSTNSYPVNGPPFASNSGLSVAPSASAFDAYLVWSYGRALSAEEVGSHRENPWQLFRAERRRLIYPYLKPINSISVLNERLAAAGMASESLQTATIANESLE